MSAEFATTARPLKAAIAWTDGENLFVEIPCKSGPPYICRYRRTLEGLTAALNILIDKSDALPPVPQPVQATSHPAVRKVATFTEDQREGVRAILKKMGVI